MANKHAHITFTPLRIRYFHQPQKTPSCSFPGNFFLPLKQPLLCIFHHRFILAEIGPRVLCSLHLASLGMRMVRLTQHVCVSVCSSAQLRAFCSADAPQWAHRPPGDVQVISCENSCINKRFLYAV